MSSNVPNKNAALATDQKAVQGVSKYFGKVKTLTLSGTSYTPVALKALFQAEIDANNALDQSRAQMAEQVASTVAVRAKAMTARKALRGYILGTYGAKAVQVLADFGMTPPKSPGPKTAEAKAQAQAKAAATRKARKAGNGPVVAAPSTAAQAETPAHVVQASQPVQTAAPAATSAPQQ